MNRTVNYPSRHRSLLLLVGLVFLLGCGGGKGPKNYVVGKVTYKGKPVLGTITFLTSDGNEVTAPINPDGSYMVGEPPMGDNKIAIRGLPGASSGPPPETPKGLTKDMRRRRAAPGKIRESFQRLDDQGDQRETDARHRTETVKARPDGRTAGIRRPFDLL